MPHPTPEPAPECRAAAATLRREAAALDRTHERLALIPVRRPAPAVDATTLRAVADYLETLETA